MLCAVGLGILAVIISAVLWAKSMRTIDLISLGFLVAIKTGLHRFLTAKPVEVTVSNGFKMVVPSEVMKHSLENVLNFKMRPDDVIVATYAKSGTTWMQEMAWLICHNADIEAAKAERLLNRYGFLEALDNQGFGNGQQSLENWPIGKRRELQAAPIGKMIWVVRDPKDVAVSYYHFMRANVLAKESRSWSEFLAAFCSKFMVYSCWFDHVEKYSEVYQERKGSMHFVSFEALKADMKEEVKRLARFLDRDLSNDQIDAIVAHCSFDAMSKNEMTNWSEVSEANLVDFKVSSFMRKGQVGDWKNHFTINQSIAFDKLYETKTNGWSMKFGYGVA